MVFVLWMVMLQCTGQVALFVLSLATSWILPSVRSSVSRPTEEAGTLDTTPARIVRSQLAVDGASLRHGGGCAPSTLGVSNLVVVFRGCFAVSPEQT